MLYIRVLIPIWLVGFGAANAAIWLGFWGEPEPAPFSIKAQLLVMWLAGSGYFLWLGRRLSDVWIERDELIVVRRGLEERIPLAAVEDVTQSWFHNPKQIKLRIRPGSASRDTVVFLAPMRMFVLPFSDEPVTRMLRRLVDQARTPPWKP